MAKKKTFDKEQWLADTKVRVEKAKQALESGLAALQSSDDWKRTLAAMAALGPARLGRLSFRNALLVLMEQPDARHVATFGAWKKLGRSVAKGSKALTILQPLFAPKGTRDERPRGEQPRGQRASALSEEQSTQLIGFKPLSVFALEQTEGPELPKPRAEVDLQTPEGFRWGVDQLKAVAQKLPEVAGIELRPRRAGDHPKALGWYVPRTKQIVVITREPAPGANEVSRAGASHATAGATAGDGEPTNTAMCFRTLAHEVAHALLHPKDDHHSTPEREVEAESTAFVVCHALGLPTDDVSFPYIAEWAHGTEAVKMLASTGQRILNAATKLLEVLAPEPNQRGADEASREETPGEREPNAADAGCAGEVAA